MDLPILVFKAIDFFGYVPQNYTTNKYKNITVEKDIVYDESCPTACLLDICYNETKHQEDTKWPVLVNIHGGGFLAGDKKYRKAISCFFADEGFFVFNIDYGLSPDFKYPENLRHYAKAMKWIAENGEKYNLDLNNVVVTGDSSGGHATASVAAMYSNKEFRDKLETVDFSNDLTISAIIPFCGLYDAYAAFSRRYPFNANKTLLQDMIGMKIKKIDEAEDFEFFKELSPLNYITKDFPKTFMVQVKDDIFCKGQGDILYNKLKELDIPVKAYTAKRIGDIHCFHLAWWSKSSKECMAEVKEFVEPLVKKSNKKKDNKQESKDKK